jgi:transcriptional regulator with XRE-family HTH domain
MTPNPIDEQVGRRVRMRRLMLAISQAELGAALGVTVQQVEDYESGTEHIGAARLVEIAHVLGVPTEFFFEDSTPTAH